MNAEVHSFIAVSRDEMQCAQDIKLCHSRHQRDLDWKMLRNKMEILEKLRTNRRNNKGLPRMKYEIQAFRQRFKPKLWKNTQSYTQLILNNRTT